MFPEVLSRDGIDLWYLDDDDVRVEFLIGFAEGRLSWIDRYRLPGGDPTTNVPLVGDVHVSP